LNPRLPITEAQVHYAIKYEMACTIEDVLSRRTRCLLLNAKETKELAPQVAKIMAKQLNHDENWEQEQIELFLGLAKNYHI
jgi:glycerol-3-phosphate dehydrogenase